MSKNSIVLLAHNIRSLWNVGSFFRAADAFGVHQIFLTGYTATPPRKEISKTALGAEEWIPWTHASDPFPVIASLREKGYDILSLERTSVSLPIHEWHASKPLCLILGHEILGVSKELLHTSDAVLHIEMCGKKESLNVSVACGIALYQLSKNL